MLSPVGPLFITVSFSGLLCAQLCLTSCDLPPVVTDRDGLTRRLLLKAGSGERGLRVRSPEREACRVSAHFTGHHRSRAQRACCHLRWRWPGERGLAILSDGPERSGRWAALIDQSAAHSPWGEHLVPLSPGMRRDRAKTNLICQ